MHVTTLDSASTQQLEKLVAKCDFLTLSDSKVVYPDAPGTGLPLLVVKSELCSAVISLQGAQLLEFKPVGGEALLWLSPHCDFTPGVALRGGIPLCLPWFGPHPTDSSKPKHGFARNNIWQLADAQRHVDGRIELEFLFVNDANQLFPYDFSVELRMILGGRLRLEMTVNNTDDANFSFSWVMHNYFPVKHLSQVRVMGLAGREYKDNLAHHAIKQQDDPLDFLGPVDRVFPGVDKPITIASEPAISINHHNCPSVVTWNPGGEAAAKMADVGAGQEQHFVCVERGAVLDEAWHLSAGASESAWMDIGLVS